MQFPRLSLLAPFLLVPSIVVAQMPTPPKALDDRLTVELVAIEPAIRTPTAIASDGHGRIWVLENNTHFRPKNYDGPPTDRIVMLDDFGPDGRARKVTPWADGFRDGMGLLILLPGADVVVSTRSEVIRISDSAGKAAERTTLLKLETTSNYPHNGLSGIARDGDKIYVGLGENFGAPWVLRGTDGTELRGSDEGGIFRMNLDGTGLEWWAVGVWNPFGLAIRGPHLFALDNDPSGGSLCRLLHVVRGGDYGYRFRYGRTIDHPFLSWFGQIPGTLPPVCLTGEAPCGILAFEWSVKGGMPSDYNGDLIGTTWTDRGLQRFQLKSKGLSFSSKPEWLLRGDDFRPSGVVQAPDGSLLISDWVQGSYELHGKGRVWRVRAKKPEIIDEPAEKPEMADTVGRAQTDEHEKYRPPQMREERLPQALRGILDPTTSNNTVDPYLIHRGVMTLTHPESKPWLQRNVESTDPRIRLGVLLAMRRTRAAEYRALLPQWLRDSDGAIRRAALQWISEEGLKDFRPQLDTVLEGQPTRATFLAYLATLQMLTSGKPDPKATVDETAKVALDSKRSPELRALALRLLPTDYAKISTDILRTLMDEQSAAIRTEAARILASRADESSQRELRRLVADNSLPADLRAEVVAGLALSATQSETRQALSAVQANPNAEISRLANRALGLPQADLGARRDDESLLKNGNPAAGRRIFFHPNGPRCFSCHTVEGRGMAIGPDLTSMGRFTATELLEAIRQPSKEIAPAYAQWHVKTRDGKEGIGIDLFEDNKSEITLINPAAQKSKYKVDEIISREVMPLSMMPPGLDATLTPEETRDLIAFLRESRE